MQLAKNRILTGFNSILPKIQIHIVHARTIIAVPFSFKRTIFQFISIEPFLFPFYWPKIKEFYTYNNTKTHKHKKIYGREINELKKNIHT